MIEIVGVAVLVNMFTHWFLPLQKLKQRLGWHKLPDMFSFLNCSKCMGLWVGLAVTQNLYLAVAISFTSYLVDNLIWWIENNK
jgi:hypothetical protein